MKVLHAAVYSYTKHKIPTEFMFLSRKDAKKKLAKKSKYNYLRVKQSRLVLLRQRVVNGAACDSSNNRHYNRCKILHSAIFCKQLP